MMTPKEMYEVRRTRRQCEREAAQVLDNRHAIREIETEDLFDRLATAFERIADALERKP